MAGRWEWKDILIALLGLVVLVLGGLLWRGEADAERREGGTDEVAVFDVVLDREGRKFLEVHFDRPLGEGLVGDVLAPPPATLHPAVGGVWRWRDRGVLRFEATGALPAATEIEISLIADRILGQGERLVGESVQRVVTDQFLVEQVDVYEEPAPDGADAQVIYRGELRFNYPVNPEELAPLIALEDGAQDVPVELETYWPAAVVGFRTGPVTKSKAERSLAFSIVEDLTPANGNVPLAGPFTQEIPVGSREVLAVRGVQAQPGESESSLRIRLSSPVAPSVAQRFLTLEPAVADLRLSASRNELIATGAMVPGSTYTVQLAAGLPAGDGASLKEAFEQKVSLPNLEPSIEIRGAGMFLPASGSRTLAVETVNVDRFTLAIDRVYLNNLFYALQEGGFSATGSTGYVSTPRHAMGGRLRSVELRVEGGRNRKVATTVTLDQYADLEGPGLYRASVTRRGNWRGSTRWVLLTDLGVVAKQSGDDFLVVVSSLDDLAAVAGARVRLLSSQNQLVAEGRTDARGLWRLGGDLAARLGSDNARPYLVTVERGDDFSFLVLDQARVDTTGLDVGGAPLSAQGYSAFLYGERDLYRPGETVEGLGILRDAALAAPAALPVVLRHRDPRGRERDLLRKTSDDKGLVPFELELPAYSLTGNHSLDLEIGNAVVSRYLFQVEEFIPDRIKAAITPGEAPLPGEELSFEVEGRYLFGPPGADLPVEARVRLVDSTFAPEGFEGFIFRNGDRRFEDQPLLTEEGTLDAEGRKRFAVAVPRGLTAPSSLQAILTARVSERGGRGVTARQRVAVHPVPYYPGLRKVAEGYGEPGQATEFELVTVDPAGQAVAAEGLRAELFRDRWNTVLRRTPSGTYRYESSREATLVDTLALTAPDGRSAFSFTPPETGAYRVVLTDLQTSASTEVGFYASGWGYAPWAIDNPARVELDLDRGEYGPGDTAVVQVRAPFAGRLLLTVERDRIFHTELHELTGNTATLSIPLSGALRPNAYVTALVVRNADDLGDGEVTRAFGAVPISVDRTSNRLDLEIVAPEEMRSERSLEVAVAAAPGATVTVAAVDEGILQLVSQATADPFAFFYRKLGLSVRTFDGFSLLLPEVPVAGDLAVGGGAAGAGMAQYVQTDSIRRVVPVAYWSGPLTAGADGRVETSFEVPNFQGALRVMVVAADGRRFGSEEQMVRVRDPLVVTPTFPRFLAWGDQANIPVTVRNDTGSAGDFEVRIEGLGEPVKGKVSVPDGSEAVTYVPIVAPDAGSLAELKVVVQGNGEAARSEVALPMRSHLPYRVVEQAGPVDGNPLEVRALADWARPGSVERTLRLGPVPLVQFAGKLAGLLRYPYGCLEQTVSTAFPLIYLEDLARRLEPELFNEDAGRPAPAAAVEEGIRRISRMQNHTGGFTLWPGGGETAAWPSVWATHFLVEARRAGYSVEGFLYDGALRWTGNQARAKATYGAAELERTVYALYVLARADRPDLGTMDFLRQQKQMDLSPSSRALLAAAYSGDATAVDELTAGIEDAAAIGRHTGGNLGSQLRNRALLLLALAESKPGDPRIGTLVDRLARDLDTGRGWTTQESAFALLALGEVFRRQEESADYGGAVAVGGRRLGRFDAEMTAFPSIAGSEPLVVTFDDGFEAGDAFYSVYTRGLPTEEAFRPENAGLEVEREWFDRERNRVDPARISQGDLIVIKTRVRSITGQVDNIVLQTLLPAGLEVENPRLDTTETLPWITDADLLPDYLDLRDDRLLLFTDLSANQWKTFYSLVRAVVPGTFKLPPVEAEAMYNPSLRAVGAAGVLEVSARRP
ncbi:MAG: MG2 domain-containing protein [Acidobacteriota bacterium]